MSFRKWAQGVVIGIAGSCAMMNGASAQLLDPSFESVCNGNPFQAWTPLGGNQFQNNQFYRSAVRCAVMWGDFFPGATAANPTGLNNVGYQQSVTLPPNSDGAPITGSAWVLNQSGDPLGLNCYAFIVVDFLAGDTPVGTALTSEQFGNGTNAYDTYQLLSVSGTVPAGATRVRLSVMLQQQLDFSTDPLGVYRGGSVRYDDASLVLGSSNILVNGDFETSCPKPFFDWEDFGVFSHPSNVEARTGTTSNKGYGPFFNPGNTGGFYQERPAAAGSQWQGSIYYLSRADDQIADAIDARVRLEFYDNTNLVIGDVAAYQSPDIALGAATPTTWTLASTPLVTAPAGTVKVRIVVIHTVPNFNGGAIYYDDASLVEVTGACCVGSVCSLSNATACGSGTFTLGGACSPNPCSAPTTGACCSGSTCSVATAAACTGVNTSFAGAGTACNVAGNNTTPCCKADFNQSGGVTVQDIFDFLAGYFSNDVRADVNASGSVTVQDIFDFLSAYFTGC
jgi:hypothetical protein